jgi:hypothetical protein
LTKSIPQRSTASFADDNYQRTSLREQVERLLPSWESWYPSLFHAAEDLGLIRARVCSPDSLMLSSRHAAIQSEAVQAFKDQWCVEDEMEQPSPLSGALRRLGVGPAHGTGRKAPNKPRGYEPRRQGGPGRPDTGRPDTGRSNR